MFGIGKPVHPSCVLLCLPNCGSSYISQSAMDRTGMPTRPLHGAQHVDHPVQPWAYLNFIPGTFHPFEVSGKPLQRSQNTIGEYRLSTSLPKLTFLQRTRHRSGSGSAGRLEQRASASTDIDWRLTLAQVEYVFPLMSRKKQNDYMRTLLEKQKGDWHKMTLLERRASASLAPF